MKVKGEVGLRAAAQANVELKTDVKAEVVLEARRGQRLLFTPGDRRGSGWI